MEDIKQMASSTGKPVSGFAVLFDYVEILVLSVCAVFLIFTFGVRLCRVDGPSMNNTLADGDNLLITSIGYTPERGDILVFHQTIADKKSQYYETFNENIIKRVIGLSGDHILIDYAEGHVFVNGTRIEEPYLAEIRMNGLGVVEYDVPDGKLFVMGDNRNYSADSRSQIIGFVDERRVLGKVLCRVLPVSKFGTVE